MLGGSKPTLYGYSAQRYDWVPSLAADFPSPLAEEVIGDETFWTTEVSLRPGVMWSDGNDVLAEDFAFTAQTAVELQLTGSWPSIVDPEYFDHAEAIGPHNLKIYFKQKPGLARWQFGLAFMPIFSKAYWEPIVEMAKQAGDITEQQKALFAHLPDGEPSAGGFLLPQWERGAFAEKDANPGYYFNGARVVLYANGAYVATKSGAYEFTAFGEAHWRNGPPIHRGALLGKHNLLHIRQSGCCRARIEEGRHRLHAQSPWIVKGPAGPTVG